MHPFELTIWETFMVFALKVLCFGLGFFVVKLGYNLVREGVRGEFKFSTEFKGIKGGLVSSSPGLLFVALGVGLIGYSMYVTKPFEIKYRQGAANESEIPNPHRSDAGDHSLPNIVRVDSLK